MDAALRLLLLLLCIIFLVFLLPIIPLPLFVVCHNFTGQGFGEEGETPGCDESCTAHDKERRAGAVQVAQPFSMLIVDWRSSLEIFIIFISLPLHPSFSIYLSIYLSVYLSIYRSRPGWI